MPGTQRDDANVNPNVATSYDQLFEQINYRYNIANPTQPYLFMSNPSPVWNPPLSPQPDLSSQRTLPTSNIPHNHMHENSVNLHSNSNYPVQSPFPNLENHGIPFMRSSSDLNLRINEFASRENPPFSAETFASNLEALNASIYVENGPNLIQRPVVSMPTLPQEYPIGQFLPNDGHATHANSFISSPPQSSSKTQTTSINEFATKLSLGTWVSPLQPIANNYSDSGEKSAVNLSQHPADLSASSHSHIATNSEANSFPLTSGRAKKTTTTAAAATTKPSYSDVLSKKASQETKSGLNGFHSSYSKNNLLAESNSGHQKPRNEPSHKSVHSKKGKSANIGARCNSPNTSVNYANLNTFNHGSKEGAYSKVGLDHFDVPENAQNSKNALHYHAYKNNLNCNLDITDKSLKKPSSSSHSSPVHSKRIFPPKAEKKGALKLDESSSTSDSEKVACDQLNNHVPFSQQKQTPKRTSFINNNLSPATAGINSAKTNNSSSSDNTQAKSGGTYFKDDHKTRDTSCNSTQSLKFPSSNVQACAPTNSCSAPKEANARCSMGNSRSARVSTNKERAKDAQGKRNIGKKRKETSPYNHSELLMTGWTLLLVWIGVAAKAGLWLLVLILDVVRMSTRLFVHMCLQVLSSGKLQCLKFKAYSSHHWGNWMGYIFKQKKESKRSGRSERKSSSGLETNIPLPTTGEEAMKRLLACRGKDPYSILGVTKTCSDDDIKKYYKRQAFLVHPDKNKQPGAEEAFKILAHAFEIIGEPERRVQYDTKLAEEVQFEGAWGEMASLLSRLKEKIEEAANTIRCTNCNRRHRRMKLPRPIYAARHCADCQIKHAAREGDIWAESCFFGLRWRYFACMEGAIYDISEWAACQRENLKHLQANTHSVQYRIVSGRKNSNSKNNVPECPTDPELEEFFNNLCRERFRNDLVPGQPSNSDTRKRKGKKKK